MKVWRAKPHGFDRKKREESCGSRCHVDAMIKRLLAITLPWAATLAAQEPAVEAMPRALEVRWALSALPDRLRDSATAYVLDPARGYVVAHAGTNGMSCIVVRSDWQFDLPFRSDIYWPV